MQGTEYLNLKIALIRDFGSNTIPLNLQSY